MRVKVIRTIQYEGPEEWVEFELSKSLLSFSNGRQTFKAGRGKVIALLEEKWEKKRE